MEDLMMDHICYFNKKSIEAICNKFNFEVLRLDVVSYSFNEDHKFQKSLKIDIIE